ncbi:MAG: hypothetical protein A2X46_07190 [Lentisphaerae bacterium GWF2_57_35]|nr:MAG: hypothetical protein A2X46_07190 [Lentisphaerae bacterium GWF2_57_35]
MGAVLTAAIAGLTTVQAAESSLDAAYFSSYVWRGQVLNDESVLQPAFTTTTDFGLSLNAWGNMDLTDQFDNRGELSEVDLTVSYALPLEGLVGVEVGVIEYLFPKEGNFEEHHDLDTREFYGKVSIDVVSAPTLAVYYDADEVDGAYGTAGVSHSFDLVEKLTLDVAASIGVGSKDYNEYYFAEDSLALNDINGSAGLSYAVTEKLSLSGVLQYTFLPDSKISDGAEEIFGKDDRLFVGVSASYGF